MSEELQRRAEDSQGAEYGKDESFSCLSTSADIRAKSTNGPEHSLDFKTLFETMTQGVVVQDMTGEIIAANPAAEQMLGISREEITGRFSQDRRWQAIRQDGSDYPGDEHPSMRALSTGRLIRDTVIGIYNPTLALHRWLQVDAIPQFRSGDTNPYQVYSLFTDISERLAHESAIQRLNLRLKRTMAETHHRVKNNLQVISALVDLSIPDDEIAVPISALSRIGQHTRSLALIHDLLTVESRNNNESLETISIREALVRLTALLQQTLSAPRRLRLQSDELQLTIREIGSLTLAANELVANAIKHGRGDIEMTFTVDGSYAQLAVRDDGDGFAAGFNPQTSANTGLDLIDSAGRYDLNGTVTYTNHPDGGALITLRFPIPNSL